MLGLLAKNADDVAKQVSLGLGKSSVWELNPFKRGREIEKALGQNLPGNFPTIDKFISGTATSIKSLDLNAASYQNLTTLNRTLTKYIDSVAGFSGRTWAGASVSGVSSRTLDLAVPDVGSWAQQAILSQANQYSGSMGVTLNVIIFP